MKVMRAFWVAILLLFFSAASCFAQNSKLETAKEEIKTGETKTEEPSTKSSRYSSESATDNRPAGSGFLIVEGAVKFFVYTYYVTIGNYSSEAHLSNYLAKWPYEDFYCGNYIALDGSEPDRRLGRVDFAEHVLFGDELMGNHLKARLRPIPWFYVQADYILLLEEQTESSGYNHLDIYNLNLCYDRLRFQNFNLGWMLGANILGSGVKKAGFTYGLSFEYFSPYRVSLYAAMRGSRINTRPLDQLEIYARYSAKRFTLDVGYEIIRLGAQDFHFLGVGGGFYL